MRLLHPLVLWLPLALATFPIANGTQGAQARERVRPRAGPGRVALFETEPIEADTFLLHGTVPIPPGVYPRKDGQSPFHVLDGPGGAPVPAQVAVVSRRPNGEADVLEVMARVHGRRARAPLTKETPDARRPRFVLVLSPAPTLPAPEVPASVAELLAPRGRQPLRLRARDVFGHLYEVNLRGSELDAGFGSRSVLKSGRWVRQTRTYGTMVCEKPARPKNRYTTLPPPLPHLFGVHAYITEYAGEERVSIDLRIHNGHSAGSRKPHIFEAPLGLVYFDSLELILPAGWTAVPRVRDPFFGEPRREKDSMVVPIVAPLQARAEGEAPPLHMIGPRGQFHRRLEIVPLAEGSSPAKAIREARGSLGLAFPVPRNDLWSWQNPSTARFGPQRTILAGWDFYRRDGTRGPAGARAADGAALSVLAGLLREGNAGADSVAGEVMGWAHPWFGKYQGVTGGFAVDTIGGARVAGTASQDGYRRLELLHRMNTCRQPQALYDWRGEPVGYHQWVTPKGRVSLRYRSNVLGSPPSQRLPCRRGPQASVQAQTAILTDRRPAPGALHEVRPGPGLARERRPRQGRFDPLRGALPPDGPRRPVSTASSGCRSSGARRWRAGGRRKGAPHSPGGTQARPARGPRARCKGTEGT